MGVLRVFLVGGCVPDASALNSDGNTRPPLAHFVAPVQECIGPINELTLVDVDRDGRADSVAIEAHGVYASHPALVVRHGLGNGHFVPPAVPELTTAVDMQVVDFDGDGQLDLLVLGRLDETGPVLALVRGHGDGLFDAPTKLASLGASPVRLLLADLAPHRRHDGPPGRTDGGMEAVV